MQYRIDRSNKLRSMRIGRYGEVCVLVVEVDVEVGGGAYDGPVVDVDVFLNA